MWNRGNSLSQNLTVLPAPSGREPLALPEALQYTRELSHYVKSPISDGAVAVGDWGSYGTHPLSFAALSSSPKGTPFSIAANFPAATKAVPLGKVA